jgi:ABC-type transport system involved in cytochrome bd biosynthesis fused ATPase/permease subunit
MNPDSAQLYQLIKKYHLDYRHPKQLGRVVNRIEGGKMRSNEARRWLNKPIFRKWIKEQQRRFNPFPPAPSREEIDTYDIEIGESVEQPGIRVGIKIIDHPGKHPVVCGQTGSGKSTVIRRIIDGINTINRNIIRVHNDPDS